jgi:phosphoserine phosphatase
VGFVTQHLPTRVNARLHEMLNRHLNSGDQAILISNSLDVVVEPIAQSLGISGFASPVAFENDVCLGRLNRDIKGRKHEILSHFLEGRRPCVIVYTDNLTDRQLLEMADERHVVIPQRRSKRRWGNIDAKFIEL